MSDLSRRLFGHTKDGLAVEALTLDNGSISCEVITFGAALYSLCVPDRYGVRRDVVLGYDSLAEYENRPDYVGAVVGRYANRIENGRFTMSGQTYSVTTNEGPNHLHGGTVGFTYKVWSVAEHTPTRLVLTLTSPDGEEGFPGTLQAVLTYALEGTALSMRYQATTDRETPCSMTGHAYFNLDGHKTGPISAQTLRIFGDTYLPTDAANIPTGQFAPVAGTPMDFRSATPIGARIDDDFIQLVQTSGYDHTYPITGWDGSLRKAAQACSPASGICMDVYTTLPGMHLCTPPFMDEGSRGKDGAVYGPRPAFCLETQFYPDSVNKPAFPCVFLQPGQQYDHKSVFSFSCVQE